MELRGNRVVLRPLAESDVDRIVALGADPEVERWWRGLTPEQVLEKAQGGVDGMRPSTSSSARRTTAGGSARIPSARWCGT
jgi:hypothetical protein